MVKGCHSRASVLEGKRPQAPGVVSGLGCSASPLKGWQQTHALAQVRYVEAVTGWNTN